MTACSSSELRLPSEFRKPLLRHEDRRDVYRVLRKSALSTVCEEARCPNIGECFSQKTATFMIMGDRCTRRCHFCSVTTKKPLPLDPQEPDNIAQAVADLALNYVVITSVDRDELPDLGASHFVHVVNRVHERMPKTIIELLTPDFKGRKPFLDQILDSPIKVFGHNIETVERIYQKLRPQSNFVTTTNVLEHIAQRSNVLTKSGMMVGVGETDDEVCQTLSRLKELGVDIVTIGQYLRPSRNHWPVHRFVQPESYQRFLEHAHAVGLAHVVAGPFVRSSYRAAQVYDDFCRKEQNVN